MNAALFLIIGCAVLVVGYIFYGGWLAKKWGVDNSRPTPAHTLEDGKDYCPAKAPVLMGHHFSSIAGAGPINGPIQAAVFGWVPVMLWILIGGKYLIIGGADVGIFDDGGDVLSGGNAAVQAREKSGNIRLPPGRGERAATRSPAVQKRLQRRRGQSLSGGDASQGHADDRAVGAAEQGQTEGVSDGAGHGASPFKD